MMRVYAERHLLPWRRLQLQTAIVGMVSGAPNTPLSAYDVDPVRAPVVEDTADEIGAVFAAVSGGNIVKLKGWKKRAP